MTRNKAILKYISLSGLGIFMFFISIEIWGSRTIPINHIVNKILTIPYFMPIYGTLIVGLGAVLPFVKKTWRKSKLSLVISIFNVLGLVFTLMSIFQIGPEIIIQESMGPYVLNKVVIPVVLIVPVGSVFLSLLVSYGLMESIGTIMEPIMKPVFRTPGRSAIDAVASFVGSYSLALLVTNRVYRENKYTAKEASIIATGFSTVSATFMIITLNTLDMMEYWNLYFWTTLLITFAVTAITTRIYPLSKMSNDYYDKNRPGIGDEAMHTKNRFKDAWNIGIENAIESKSVIENTKSNLRDGVKLAINIGATMMSIGVVSLFLAQYTRIFDVLGMVFYPLTSLLGADDPMLLAKASTISLADMYVPAIISTGASLQTRYIVAVMCISEILFFSASIPCIMATDIPVNLKDIVIVWFQRVVLTLIIVVPLARMLF